jgi:hypothetical protein
MNERRSINRWLRFEVYALQAETEKAYLFDVIAPYICTVWIPKKILKHVGGKHYAIPEWLFKDKFGDYEAKVFAETIIEHHIPPVINEEVIYEKQLER